MSIPTISGINSSTISRMYSSGSTGNGHRYTLTENGRYNAIKELETKLSKGEITENEFNQKKAAINSAPRVVFVDTSGINHKGEFAAEDAEKSNESGKNKEIKKLQKQFETGEISPFEYRANMYMMTNPITMEAKPTGQKLSILA